jgi:hypothetical protein
LIQTATIALAEICFSAWSFANASFSLVRSCAEERGSGYGFIGAAMYGAPAKKVSLAPTVFLVLVMVLG